MPPFEFLCSRSVPLTKREGPIGDLYLWRQRADGVLPRRHFRVSRQCENATNGANLPRPCRKMEHRASQQYAAKFNLTALHGVDTMLTSSSTIFPVFSYSIPPNRGSESPCQYNSGQCTRFILLRQPTHPCCKLISHEMLGPKDSPSNSAKRLDCRREGMLAMRSRLHWPDSATPEQRQGCIEPPSE